jgi:hypothetical protein
VVGRYAFRGTGTSDVTLFGEGKLLTGARPATLRVEVFNLFNHANILGRNGVYGDAATPLPTFGWRCRSRQRRARTHAAGAGAVQLLAPIVFVDVVG